MSKRLSLRAVQRKNFTLINFVVLLLGLRILALGAYIENSQVGSASYLGMGGMGTGLVTAALVTLFARWFLTEPEPNMIEIEHSDRTAVTRLHQHKILAARKVDLLSMSGIGWLREQVGDREHKLLGRVVTRRTDVRVMFVDPECAFVKIRAIADRAGPENLSKLFKKALRLYCQLGEDLEQLAKSKHYRSNGTLEIRMTDECPHVWICRTDNEIRWGAYNSNAPSISSASFILRQNVHPEVFDQFANHFENIWGRGRTFGPSLGDEFLIRYDREFGVQFNEALIEHFLGKDWRTNKEQVES